MRLEYKLAIGLALWVIVFGGFAYWFESPCHPSNEGTDYWYEVCMDAGPIDLGVEEK